jgi:hypothetical protein
MSDIEFTVSRAEGIRRAAEAEVAKEQGEAAKKALIALYKRKAVAEEAVRGIEREIETTLAKIEAGAL